MIEPRDLMFLFTMFLIVCNFRTFVLNLHVPHLYYFQQHCSYWIGSIFKLLNIEFYSQKQKYSEESFP